MRTVLVTGGAGFIGSNFIRYYLKEHPNDRVINIDALTYAGNLQNLVGIEEDSSYRFVKGDICDRNLVESLFAEEKVNTVVHFAAESHVDRSIKTPESFIQTNIFGTFVLLDVAKNAWKDNNVDNRFLHVSTDEVYGSLSDESPAFTEETPYAPNSPYSASKASSDHLVRSYFHTYKLPVLTTNCSNNYGPYQFPEKLIPLIYNNILNHQPIPVYGDGSNIRDWLYVEDHCSGIDTVLQKGSLGETYNIGGCNEWKNIDIVHLICDHLDTVQPSESSYRELIHFVTDRPGHDYRYAIDSKKIQEDLGWEPSHQFEEGIIKTLEWYRANSDWLESVIDGNYRNYYKEHYNK